MKDPIDDGLLSKAKEDAFFATPELIPARPPKSKEDAFNQAIGMLTMCGLALFGAYSCCTGCGESSKPSASNVAQTSNRRVVNAKAIGCRTREDRSRVTSLAVSGDDVAFQRFIESRVIAGACELIPQGTVVFVEDMTWDGLNQVRPEGSLNSFWVVMESIK